ncbi:MAG: hypothetical protein WD226_12635 [Planctomycetota bacterium]
MLSSPILARVLVLASLASSAFAQCDLAKLTAAASFPNDDYGTAVAISGNTILVGAPRSDLAALDAGAAFFYENVGGIWVEQSVTACDAAASDAFGQSVAIDGDVAVIGAPAEQHFGFNSGAAYIFQRVAGTWVETQKLLASNGALGDLFGISTSVSGSRIVVGACQLSSFQIFGVGNGKLLIFEQAGSAWVEDVILTASDGSPGDRFGVEHAIDDDLIVISAENKNIVGPTSGAAYLFERVAGAWTELDRIEPSDGAAGDFFSMGLALDGNTVASGSPEHSAAASHAGAVYLFERSGNSWIETQKLLPAGLAANDWFGRSIALADGVLWSGAFSIALSTPGTVYGYAFDGANWAPTATLAPGDVAVGHQHGYAVAIDGDRLVATSRKYGPGSAYVYSSSVDAIQPLGCDLNPAGSLSVVSGTSSIGDSLTVAVHNPLGTQTPGASIGFIAIMNSELLLPNGCGFPFAWDMTGGTAGELLVDPNTQLDLLTTSVWTGTPVSSVIQMPASCSLAGTTIALQGVMFDTAASGPGDVKFALTRAFSVTLGH